MQNMGLKEVMELLKGTKKKDLLFRKEARPKLLFEKGNKPDRAPVGVLEPKGLYMVEKGRLNDLPDLVNPKWSDRHRAEKGKEFGAFARSVTGMRNFERMGSTTKVQEHPWLMVGALAEGEKTLDLSNPDKYRNFLLKQVKDYVKKEKAFGTQLENSPEAIRHGIITAQGEGSVWRDLENFPEHITDVVRKRGYAAVKVPDVAVGQADRVQTVVVKPGVLAARQGKWAGMLGLGGVAAGATLMAGEGNAQAHLEVPKSSRGYRAPDFLADMKDLAGTKPMQELGEGFDILEHTRKAVDWTSGLVDKALGVLGGFVKGVSEAQQANFAEMAKLDPSKGMTKEQLDATIETVIDATTFSPLILKKAAMKGVAKDFGERLGQINEAKAIAFDKGLSWSKEYLSGATESLKKNFGVVARALRRMPQEALDPVDSVRLENIAGAKGVFRPGKKEVAFNIERNISSGTVAHEFLHPRQVGEFLGREKGIPDKAIPKAFFEAEAHEFGTLMEKWMSIGTKGKVGKKTFDLIADMAKKNVVERWGNEPFAYDMDEVLKHYVESAKLSGEERKAVDIFTNIFEEQRKGKVNIFEMEEKSKLLDNPLIKKELELAGLTDEAEVVTTLARKKELIGKYGLPNASYSHKGSIFGDSAEVFVDETTGKKVALVPSRGVHMPEDFVPKTADEQAAWRDKYIDKHHDWEDIRQKQDTTVNLRKFADANDVEFQGRWEDFDGWLLTDRKTKSSSLVRSEDDARKAIAKMRGVKEEDLFELSGWHGGRELEGGKFSSEKVGSGQGLAVGWGTYVSDLEEVGRYYAQQADMSVPYQSLKWQVGDKVIAEKDISGSMANTLDRLTHQTKGEVIRTNKSYLEALRNDLLVYDNPAVLPKLIKEQEEVLSFLDTLEEEVKVLHNPNAYMHKVTAFKGKAPEEHPWLDWDKPLSEQSEATKEALEKLKTVDKGFSAFPYETGKDIYKLLTTTQGSRQAASEALAKVGIAGNRYPTGMFDQKPTPGKYNYVIFEPEAIEVEKSLPFSRKGE